MVKLVKRSFEPQESQGSGRFSTEIWNLIIENLVSDQQDYQEWNQISWLKQSQSTISSLNRSTKWLKELTSSLFDHVYLDGFEKTESFLSHLEGRTLATRSLTVSLKGHQPASNSIGVMQIRLLRGLPEGLPNLESLIIQDKSEAHPSTVQSTLEIPLSFMLPTTDTSRFYCRWSETLQNVELQGVEILWNEDQDLSDDEGSTEESDLPAPRAIRSLDLSNSILSDYAVFTLLGSRSLRNLQSLSLRNVKDLSSESGMLLRRVLSNGSRRPTDTARLTFLDLDGTGLEKFLTCSSSEMDSLSFEKSRGNLGGSNWEEDDAAEIIEEGSGDYWDHEDSERSDDEDDRAEKEENDRSEWFGLEKEEGGRNEESEGQEED